jgi:murein DD-endopeptidase MepM/ murein hydrolase activator NlpD
MHVAALHFGGQMPSLRAIRTSRSLTFIDLSSLTSIPARALAEAEYGLRPLSHDERGTLAFVLGMRATDIAVPVQAASARTRVGLAANIPGAPALVAAALAATLATATIQGGMPQISLPQQMPRTALAAVSLAQGSAGVLSSVSAGSAKHAATAINQANLASLTEHAAAPIEPIAPALLLAPAPIEPAPAFQMTAAGPAGCPVQPITGRTVLTQGYGVGSHAPTQIWGAVDLAVDGDDDGYANPDATWYSPVVATHAGVVRVDLDSYPAGNHVWVNDRASSWRTGYSHLAIVTVLSGQYVRSGEVIGMIGSTGEASGPHLDYQVWNGEVNVDPIALIGCG